MTDLVMQIVRREFNEDPQRLLLPWLDIPNSAITLEAIRTRMANDRTAQCAAFLKFDLALKPGFKWNTPGFVFGTPAISEYTARLLQSTRR